MFAERKFLILLEMWSDRKSRWALFFNFDTAIKNCIEIQFEFLSSTYLPYSRLESRQVFRFCWIIYGYTHFSLLFTITVDKCSFVAFVSYDRTCTTRINAVFENRTDRRMRALRRMVFFNAQYRAEDTRASI